MHTLSHEIISPCHVVHFSGETGGRQVEEGRAHAHAPTHSLTPCCSVLRSHSPLSPSLLFSPSLQIVGPMNTLAGTRNLLGEELASVGVYAQRLFESGHPIIHKTKGLIFDVNNSRQLRGLTILLLSKVINTGGHTGSISSKQRALAEITELILAANLLHDGVIELEPCRPPSDPDASVGSIEGTHLIEADRLDKGLRFGNKIAILGGDFLLASACTSLARLHNAKAVMLVSSGISSCTEGLALTTAHSAAAASGAVLTLTEWRHSAELVSATLFSHCCEAAACLHDHSPNVQAAAAEFGTRFAVAYVSL
jgi:decaprenyl-diphosphate synthase subunit 2